VAAPEDAAGDQPGQGDVRGRRHPPAAQERSPVVDGGGVDPEVEQQPEPGQEHAHRSDHAAAGRQQRIQGLAERVQAAAGQAGLGDLLGGDAEEEDHEDVVDQEVEAHGVPEDRELAEGLPVQEMGVGVWREVGGQHRHQDTRDEWDRELLEQVEGRAHVGGPSSLSGRALARAWRMQRRLYPVRGPASHDSGAGSAL
jgi:hypothetical protein